MLVFSGYELKRLLAREPKVSFNLGLGEGPVRYHGRQAEVAGETFGIDVKRLHEDRVYVVLEGKLKEASFFSGNVYGLRAIEGHAPTIEINGIRMHRVPGPAGTGPAPEEDAENRVRFIGLEPGARVLDTCGGLGYSALAALRAGGLVTCLEADENVQTIASYNPWSAPFFEAVKAGKIELRIADCSEEIKKLGSHSFDAVLHDPPRYGVAPLLYSGGFYEQVFRVLEEGGKLFHYTGKPQEKNGRGIRKGVVSRMRKAGFRGIEWNDECLGFRAWK